MISDLDIYRAAKMYMDIHGEAALLEAARMFDLMTERNDLEGRRVWQRIYEAIDALDPTKRPERDDVSLRVQPQARNRPAG